MYNVSHVHINKSICEYFTKNVGKEKEGNFVVSFKKAHCEHATNPRESCIIFYEKMADIFIF